MSRYYYEPVIWHQLGTRGHSAHNPRTYAMPVRRHEPVVIIPRASKYDTRHDYGIDDSINRADYLSSAVLEDTYEAANRSRGKDNALLRDVKSAIRPSSLSRESTPTRAGRPSKRFRSVPPVDIQPTATSKALVPYRSPERIKSALSSTPSPTSLLSSRINSYLRGSSLPPHSPSRDIGSGISYKSFLSRPEPVDNLRSHVSYRSYLSDPSITSPFATRSSTKLIQGYTPRSYSPYRSTSPYVPNLPTSYGYGDDDDDDYEPETSYRRKYKIVHTPGGGYGGGVREIGQPAITYPSSGTNEGSDLEEEYDELPEHYGTYSCPRPSDAPSYKLSSYDGDYDGSYDADMAEMYDYVPYGPSRQGILELTEHGENDLPYSSLTSSTPSSLIGVPRLSSPPLTSVSVQPSYSKYLDKTYTKPTPSSALLDSLMSSTAARARQVLADSKLPEYRNASLVLSVEGSAVSEDGKNRYGFRYYPPPIPLKGSHIGLDERILGVVPKPISPADSFLSNYLNKLRDIRTEVRDHVDRGDYARGRSVAPVSRPTYDHRTVHMPVTVSGRPHSVPVSSYRSRLDDGQSHRVDVFPLVVSETTLPKDKKLHLPVYGAGAGGGGRGSGSPTKLTVLEKINIKVDTEQHVNPRVSAVSRRVRASTAPPASRPAARPAPGLQVQQQQYVKVAAEPLLAKQYAAGPVFVFLAPSSRYSYINNNIPASKPVVLSQAEAPWYLRARAGSVPPPNVRQARATSVPPPRSRKHQQAPPPQPLPTAGLWAHRRVPLTSDVLRRARARSLEPSRRFDLGDAPPPPQYIPSAVLWAHRPRTLSKDAARLSKVRNEENRRSYPGAWARASSVPLYYERASDYYPRVPDIKEVALSRYLYAHRGRFGPDSKPPRPTLGNFPQVYVPWKGPGPSNRSKAAIIGSRLDAAEGGKKQRRPRSEFAANKLRELKRDEIEEGVYYRVPSSGTMQASKPPLPKPTDRKAIRSVDGFTKPNNVMSWQPEYYSLRASAPPKRGRMSARTLYRPLPPPIYVPPAPLYSPTPPPLPPVKIKGPDPLERPKTPSTLSMGGSSVNIPAYYAAGGDPNNPPVSDLRRRLRRTIARAKNNPEYYRE